jgi:hypothetical protein
VRYFEQIAAGIDCGGLLHQITVQPELWNAYPLRSRYGDHTTTDDILLRYVAFDPIDDDMAHAAMELECINYPPFAQLPMAVPVIFGLMARVNGERLGRVFVSRLPPEAAIARHSDRNQAVERDYPNHIRPAVYYERYQLTLAAADGVIFRCADEQVFMPPGSIWWFDHRAEHEVINRSAQDRIAMTIDIRPFKTRAPRIGFDND